MVTVINFWWKISLHSVGAGALIGLVLMLSLKMLAPLDLYLISANNCRRIDTFIQVKN